MPDSIHVYGLVESFNMTYLRPRGSHVSCSSPAGKLELAEITLLWEGGKQATIVPKTARKDPRLGF